jgi:localization factor PodJL
MRSAPWQVKDIDPAARETAREAARRSGMSVGQWLNTVILDQAADGDLAHPDDDAPPHAGEGIASLNERLDGLSRQLDRLAANHPAGRTESDDASQKIADAILRLNGRLDQVLTESRTASSALERKVNSVDRALASLSQERVRAGAGYVGSEPDSVDQAVAEIAARQRALDGEFAAPPPPVLQRPAFAPVAPVQCRAEGAVDSLRKDLTEIGRVLSEAMPRPAEDAVNGLRKDLAEIGRSLSEAMPRRAIEALEGEVRALAGRLDAGRQSGADVPALAGIEQGLREVRDALRGLAPAESLVGFDEAVRSLSGKIDMIAANRQDPAGLQQLEGAIASLRGVMGQVASGEALAALAQDVRGLADRIEHGVRASGGADMMSALDHRIGMIADAIESVRTQTGRPTVPPQLDALVRSLNEKLEHLQSARVDPLSRGEQLAIGGLEDRIARLVEKLDASEGRLGHLEAIERGMAELLVHLEELRANPARAEARMAASPVPAPGTPVEALSTDIATLKQVQSTAGRRTEDTLEAVQGTIETVVDRIATIETDLRKDQRAGRPAASLPPPVPASGPPSASPASAQSATAPPARSAPPAKPALGPRVAIDPSLPHDHPLEPGSGPPRARPGGGGSGHHANAADRIAASEAPLRAAKGAPSEPEPKSGYLQAARRAAQYAAQNAQHGEVAAAVADPQAIGSKLAQRLKALFVGISVAVLIVVALRFAASYFESAELALPDAPALVELPAPAPVIVASPASVPREDPSPLLITPLAETATPLINQAPVNAAPVVAVNPVVSVAPPAVSANPVPLPAPPASAPSTTDITGSVPARAAPHHAAVPAASLPPAPVASLAPPAPSSPGVDQVPAAIGGKMLVAAAAAGEPAAAYEVATRFAEGRGVPQSFQSAAVWYERAAKGGLAPALFRLGALYEKGNGVTKDLNEARRLYLAAAEKGNANAMHNVGVLYAEGIDGKPDFKIAAQWFRRSAGFGIADSQYNLAVLYARGIGVEHNLTEAYRWFALAAKAGDAEAAKKRDDIAGRLDQKALAAAREAVETFVADQPPADAAAVAPPAGGWDQAEPDIKRKSRPRAHAAPTAAPI